MLDEQPSEPAPRPSHAPDALLSRSDMGGERMWKREGPRALRVDEMVIEGVNDASSDYEPV